MIPLCNTCGSPLTGDKIIDIQKKLAYCPQCKSIVRFENDLSKTHQEQMRSLDGDPPSAIIAKVGAILIIIVGIIEMLPSIVAFFTGAKP